eukprot:SAG31_NODE_2539_length_5542_cov_2.585890_2_plen_218_part_00
MTRRSTVCCRRPSLIAAGRSSSTQNTTRAAAPAPYTPGAHCLTSQLCSCSADDWKAHHARDRQAAVFVQMEKARLEPFRGTEGADDLGFKSRQVEEFHVNRRAAAENRIPNVRSFVSKDLKYQPTATWNKKNSVWNPVETTVAAGHSTRDSLDQFAASNSSGGQNASKNPHAETEWQGFDASAAKDTYTSTRKMAAANRYQTDTPYWSRPEWMRKKN